MVVPRLIWQTWKDSEVPEEWREGQLSVIRANPGWRYTLLTDADNREICARYFPEYLATYDAFPHAIQRADAIRYVILYLFGGVYLDLDYRALRGFDSIDLDRSVGDGAAAALSANSMFGRRNLTNSFMVAGAARDPFWLRVLDETSRCVPPWADLVAHTRIFWTTGPWALGRASRAMPGAVKPLDVTAPCDICSLEDGTCSSSSAGPGGYVLEPIRGSSWHAADSTLWTLVYCRWPELLALAALVVVALSKK